MTTAALLTTSPSQVPPTPAASAAAEPTAARVGPTLLVPVDGTADSLAAVRHVIDEYRNRSDLRIHLLSVQRPLSAYVARFVRAAERRAFLEERARIVLQPAQALLDAGRVPHRTHIRIGDKADVIVALADRLRCTHIVIGTARRSSLLRWLGNSTTNRVIELTRVPVLIVAGREVTRAERYGVPAGVGAALGTLVYAAAT